MTTDLFAAAHALAAQAVIGAVPPQCTRGVDVATTVAAGEDAVVESPAWAPRAGATHLVPSLSLLDDVPLAFRLEVAARIAGAWTPWAATVTIGEAAFAPTAADPSPLTVDIDVVTSTRAVEAVRVRARLRSPALVRALAAPRLLTLSAADAAEPTPSRHADGRAALAVPAISQVAVGGGDAMRICSPASVTMVLGYWGRAADCAAVAGDVFHRATDRYGVWPANVQAAARRGVCGYLLRFPSWEAAAWCVARGLPIVASVRYAAGELAGAALAETTGHLLVVTGYEDGWVLVNDPAAPEQATVPRRYRLDELTRAWLARAGVGYVFFSPGTSRGGVVHGRDEVRP